MFFCITNWTQISLKSHSIGRIFWSQNRLDKKHLSNQLFPEQPKKTKTLKSHSMHFLLRISFNFHVLQKQPKIFKLHSGAYRQPLDVCGRPFAPPGIALFYFFERCLLSTTCGTSIFFAATVICCHRLCEWQDLVVGWDFSFFVDAVVKLCRCKSGNASDPVSQALLQPWRVEIHWNPISIMALSAWEPSLGKEHQLETTTGLFTSRPSLYSCGHPFSPCYV